MAALPWDGSVCTSHWVSTGQRSLIYVHQFMIRIHLIIPLSLIYSLIKDRRLCPYSMSIVCFMSMIVYLVKSFDVTTRRHLINRFRLVRGRG